MGRLVVLRTQCDRAPPGDVRRAVGTEATEASHTGLWSTLHPLASTDRHHASTASGPHRLALINTVSDSCGGIKSFY